LLNSPEEFAIRSTSVLSGKEIAVMKNLLRIGLFYFFIIQASTIGWAQVGIITTYAGGASMPVNGALATTITVDSPSAVVPDGAGGFYAGSSYYVFRVSSEDKVTLIAGNGTKGFSGDGGPATSAQIDKPQSLAVDSTGNLFIADSGNNRIRKVSLSGIITTVAGKGSMGYSGDGGFATWALFNAPYGIAIDSAGNLFIADTYNNRIRKVSASGIITTVAGDGSQGFSGDGGLATSAQLYLPFDVAIDSAGNLFVADGYNNRIRKVSASGIITTVAGSGSAGYRSGGFGGDGGQATSALLNIPWGVAVDSEGNLFISDQGNSRILKASMPNVSTDFKLSAWGVGQSTTVGGNLQTQSGYAAASVRSWTITELHWRLISMKDRPDLLSTILFPPMASTASRQMDRLWI
jgi:sugar lactone lactonase YvrE